VTGLVTLLRRNAAGEEIFIRGYAMGDENLTREALLKELEDLRRIIRELESESTFTDTPRSATQYQLLLETISEPIWSVDISHRITMLNPAFQTLCKDMYGIKLERGDNMIAFIPVDFQALWKGYYERALRGENFSAEQEFSSENSSIFYEFSFSPVYENDIAIAGVTIIGRNITERRVIENKIRESEKRFRALVQNSNDIIFVLAADGTIRYISPSVERILGYSPEDISGTDIFTYVHPDDTDAIQNYFRLGLKENKDSDSFRCRIRKTDGSFAFIEGISSNHIDDVYIRGLVVNAREVSERVRIEELLRENEQRFRSIVEDLPTMICRFLPDGTLTFVNGIYCHAIRKTAGELLGKNYLNHIPEDERDDIRNLFLSLHTGRPFVSYEHRVILPDNEIRWHRWTNRAIFNEKGEIIEIQSIGEDVTERKKSEDRARLQSIALESSANVIMITDKDGRIDWVNPAFTKYTGFDAETILGKKPNILKSELHDDAFYADLWNTILSGEVWHGEIINKRADGTLIRDNTTITPVRNHRNEITHFIAVKEYDKNQKIK
jgi:PAS domain S-box-containing protein